jgi:hypothetical protein
MGLAIRLAITNCQTGHDDIQQTHSNVRGGLFKGQKLWCVPGNDCMGHYFVILTASFTMCTMGYL